MTPERWEQISKVWSEAIDLTPSDRAAFLAQACAGDQGLYAEVTKLLTNDDQAEAHDFLGVPPWALDEIPLTLPDFGDYEGIEYVGHGGMGVVYRAHQRSLKRSVALKVCHTSGILSAEDEERFRAEAEHMARLRHPNIAHVYEVGTRGDQPYFCMEFIEGTNVRERQAELKTKPREAVKLMRAVALAVHHAHLRGLLHRDLKPANILLDKDGQPHVTDFGLSKRIDQKDPDTGTMTRGSALESATRGAKGTAAFMSPEQLEGSDEQQTTLCDVFGLAGVLYALLTGRGPHQGASWNDTIANLKKCAPPPVGTLNQSVDPDLEAICMKSLAKNPSERHKSAQEFADDLGRWLGHGETIARPWGMPQRIRGWLRRNKALGLFVAASLALLVVVGLLLGQRVVEVVREPERTQLTLAKQRATLLDLRIRQLSTAVASVAKDPALSTALASANESALDKIVNAAGEERIDLDGHSPFASWFVMNRKGAIVARWPDLPGTVQDLEFNTREYFSGAIRDPTGAPHITRVYRSVADSQYKFGISAAISDGGRALGVLAGSVPTSSTLGLPAVDHDDSHSVVFAGIDPSSKSTDDHLATCEQVVLLHPAYKEGIEPVCIRDTDLSKIGIHRGYRDPVASMDDSFGGLWLGALEPVGDTGFKVLVQRRYPGAAGIPTVAIVGAVFALLLLLGGVFVTRRLLRGRARQLPGEPP